MTDYNYWSDEKKSVGKKNRLDLHGTDLAGKSRRSCFAINTSLQIKLKNNMKIIQ